MLPQNQISELIDIKVHCQYMIEDTANLTLDDFLSQRVVRQAVERNLIIIGIAATRLRDHHPEIYDDIESLRSAVGLRNRLSHGYDEEVNDESIWNVVTTSIPALLKEVESRL